MDLDKKVEAIALILAAIAGGVLMTDKLTTFIRNMRVGGGVEKNGNGFCKALHVQQTRAEIERERHDAMVLALRDLNVATAETNKHLVELITLHRGLRCVADIIRSKDHGIR